MHITTSITLSVPATGPPTLPFYAITDSSCTAHFFNTITPVCNKQPTNNPVAIHTPSGMVLHSMHDAELNIPGPPLAAQHGHVVPHLATQPLLSIGQLCDTRCNVAFTASWLPSVTTILLSFKASSQPNQNYGSLTFAHHSLPVQMLLWELLLLPTSLPLPIWPYSAQPYPPLKKPSARAISLSLWD